MKYGFLRVFILVGHTDVTDMYALSIFHNTKCKLPLKETKTKKKVNYKTRFCMMQSDCH